MLTVRGRAAFDVTSFLVITNLPAASLLIASDGFKPTTDLASWLTTVISPAFVFIFSIPTTTVHKYRSRTAGTVVSNSSILQDHLTHLYTMLLASGIFSLVLSISYMTWLPAHLNAYLQAVFVNTAISAGPYALPYLFASLLVPGWMLRDFLFVSSTGAPSSRAVSSKEETRHGEYLATTVYRYLWGSLPAKRKVLITRTVFLATMVVLTSVVQLVSTIKNFHVDVAAVWGGVWGIATLLVGLVFAWIEGVEGV